MCKEAKKYRVSESEHFNLISMYDKVKCWQFDLEEGLREDADYVENRLAEIEALLEKAPCVGSLVDLETLKRIREIRDERNLIRYGIAKENGATEQQAGYAFM